MAKPKENPDKDKATFLGKDIDPALQQKVESYMEEEPKVTPVETPVAVEATESAPEVPTPEPTPETDTAAGAPLLPTSELPDLEKKKPKKASKIEVVEHVEPEEPVEPSEIPAEDEPTTTEEVPEVEEPAEETQEDTKTVAEETEEEESDSEPAEEIAAEEAEPVEEAVADVDELGLETTQTAHAVDEIIAAEADEVLEHEDLKKAPVAPAAKEGFSTKLKSFLKTWAKTPRYRNATIIALLVGFTVASVVPNSRYFILNSLGVRASLSTKILDDKTGQPLKNVELSIGNQANKTDIDGNVKLQKIKLGTQEMKIKKPAFAEVSRKITVGWGSNPQEATRLTPIGAQYSFLLADFLSGKPVTKAEAINGEASARSNEKGEIILTVPNTDKDELDVQITAESYRTETVKVSTTKKEQQKLSLVPAHKQAFVSKRSGKFDLYKIDVDGKNEEKVLAGTGLEREDSIALVAHPKKDIVALVSTRDNVRNQDGYLLNTLTLIDLASGETTKLGQSERIQIIDWIGNKLVYVKIAQGQSAASPQRHRLVSYDIDSSAEKELASTNYFNDVVSARGAIYFAPAVYKVNGGVGLFKINPDGTNKKTIYEKEVWNLFRTSYDKVSASVGQDWYELNLPNDGFTKTNGAPPVLKSRVYVDGPDGKRSIWVDERDGKGVLIAQDTSGKDEKTLQSQSGLKNPIHWLDDDHVVYRVADGRETADYVMSLSGGEPKKIRDVTNTAGIDRWYYY